MSLAVVYLARAAEGIEPVQRFAASYRAHSAGAPHELFVICKGHEDDRARARVVAEFDAPAIIPMSDDGFDIGAYISAAARLPHQRLCFLNTFTIITAEGWLDRLDRAIADDRVGIVGAMGSYESVRDTIDFVAKATWLCVDQKIAYDPSIARQFEWIFQIYATDWVSQGKAQIIRGHLRAMLRKPAAGNREIWRAFWKARTGYGGDLSPWLEGFPPFPNPHIRSNGFIVRRQVFNAIISEAPPTKETAMHFESGLNGYTARIRKLGLAAKVAGLDAAYDIADWPKSRTFRLDRQQNLIITDNQSRGYDQMSAGSRLTHQRVTWGDYIGPAPPGFHELGLRFAISDEALKSVSQCRP